MLDNEAAAGPEEGEDVVADLEVGELLEVAVGEADELLAFCAVDRLVACSGREALARFHFADDERLAAADDEIDLAAPGADVPVDDAIAAEAVEPRGALLAAPSEVARIEAALLVTGDGSASRCRCV